MTDRNGERHNDTDFGSSQTKSSGTEAEKDDFWEIDMLLPRTRTAPRRAPGATDTTEITFGPVSSRIGESIAGFSDTEAVSDVPLNLNPKKNDVVVRHFIPPHSGEMKNAQTAPETPILNYEPEGSLIHRVRVFSWSSQYHYYRDFCADAARYLSEEPIEDGKPMSPVPFFSYVPQYSQMRKEQLMYYFYWRREFRRGNICHADDSYIYLYIYEILNTAGYETKPEDGLCTLYRLFRTYGKKSSQLTRLLSEWIVDYSLIFRLPVPENERAESDFPRMYGSTLKEFYMSSPVGGTEGYTDMLIRFCSAYDYRKSHFYTGSNRAYFDRFLPGSLAAVTRQYSDGTHLFAGMGMRDSHMIRNAFEQALCSYRIRYRIEIEYASFSRSHEMRYFVSDILKYTENRLRGYLRIKSRLSVYSLSVDVKKCIDRYCDESFPRAPTADPKRRKEEIPVYEKLYDLPKTPLSLSHAEEIELDSWETTRRLTEAFADKTDPLFADGLPGGDSASDVFPAATSPIVSKTEKNSENGKICEASEEELVPERSGATTESVLKRVLGEWYPFAVSAYLENVAEQQRFAAARGMFPDLVADRINELAADEFGDILLENSGEGYTVIEDYRSLFTGDGDLEKQSCD